MVSFQPLLDSLLSSLIEPPISNHELGTLVGETLNQSVSQSSPENRKSQWEYLLKNEIFKLAVCVPPDSSQPVYILNKDDRG